ncbi:MAG: OmpA family protein [Ignavibacteriae bacterium]|nr:OmpA family protein [Ignavibacteriota bacterium]
MKFGFLLFSIICLTTLPLFAQFAIDTNISLSRYGIYGNGALNFHSADFREFPGVPNCCPKFTTGIGTGLSLGVLYDLPISSKQWYFSLRAGYEDYSAKLTTRESILLEGGIPGTFEHRVTSKLASVGVESWLGYEVLPNLTISTGIRTGYVVRSDYSQIEVIVEPADYGVFSNGQSSRNDTSGIIPNANKIALNMLFGVSYQLPLNVNKTLFLVPELQFSYGLSQVIRGYDWQALSVHFGIALKYSPKNSPKIPSIEPEESKPEIPVITENKVASDNVATDMVAPYVPDTKTTALGTKRSALTASLTAVGVGYEGNEHPLELIRIEEFASTALHPLLQYVFFDENSAEIPEKYSRIGPEYTNKFSLLDFLGSNSMEVYYGLLNIVGYRMRTAPHSTVTLTGCNSNEGIEKNNKALSRARAESVKKYLTDVWDISPKRIKIKQRNLPSKPSNSSIQTGCEENRRVEISSDEGEIITAIVLGDTLRTITPPIIRFHPKVNKDAVLSEWNISTLQQRKISMRYEGKSTLDTNVDWKVTRESGGRRVADTIEYSFNVRDSIGQDTTIYGIVPVEQVTIQKKRDEKLTDKKIDRYNLILFDFNRSDIDKRNMSILTFVKNRISPDSRVSITGFTDQTGDEEYNTRLAQMRASSAAQALGLKAKLIPRQSEQYFLNITPEGRFYNRTVEIQVETSTK